METCDHRCSLKTILTASQNGLNGALWHSNAYDCTIVEDVVSFFLHYVQHSKVAIAIHFMGSVEFKKKLS